MGGRDAGRSIRKAWCVSRIAYLRSVPFSWAVKVNEASILDAWELIDSRERTRADSYRMAADRRRFAITRAALRCALASVTGTDPQAFRFENGRWGKPHLSTPTVYASLNFSVGHSGSLSVIALSFGGRIGVDVEQRRPVSDADAIAKGCFGNAVAVHLAVLDGDVRDTAFFQFWTAAEALAKATGLGWAGHGGCIPMHTSGLEAADVKFTDPPMTAPGLKWSIMPLEVGAHHFGALVVECAADDRRASTRLRPAVLELTNEASRRNRDAT